MPRTCDRCSADNPKLARYCCRCGQRLPENPAASASGGHLTCPAGFAECVGSPGFYYRWEAVGQSSFFGCEYIGVSLFNGREAVVEVRVKLTGRNADGIVRFEIERNVHRMDRGQPLTLELAPHDLPEIPDDLEVAVVSSKPATDHESEERRSSWERPWWSSSWD